MSGSIEKTALFKVRLLPEHPKHERLSQTTAFKPWWRIVFLILIYDTIDRFCNNVTYKYLVQCKTVSKKRNISGIMNVAALASGSSGNCFYVEQGNSALLIDVGISAKKIRERLQELKLSPEKIKGIFITHEHIDHIRGADVFARHFKVPIFATKETIRSGFLCSDSSLIVQIKNDSRVRLGSVTIETFSKPHSAADPVSYTVVGKRRVAIITDVGYIGKNVINHITLADFIFLESNHDVAMLEQGPYTAFLKAWIQSDEGHLSNQQAALGILEHASAKLSHIVLSHLSETNNTPAKALSTFSRLLQERKNFHAEITVSRKESPTALFRL